MAFTVSLGARAVPGLPVRLGRGLLTHFPVLLLLFGAPEPAADAASLEAAVRRFTEAYFLVEQEAAEPVDSYGAFYGGAIPGMLKRLDPHSVFFDPDQFAQLQELEKATRKGFGSVVAVLPGRVIVLQTLPETPSARSGMSPGDEILAINGIRLDRLSVEQLVGLLGESRRREVKLDIRRPGSSRLVQITMSPEDVESPAVDLVYFLRAGLGYIRVRSFDAATGGQVREAIEKLGGNHLKALVLDLRGNPGGLMATALETASLFLEPKAVIVSVRGRGSEVEEIRAAEGTRPYRFPVAVLVNEQTASGAEIVAGALQDHGRAVIIGSSSFGKGLVQSVFPLSEGTGLALTTAYYYTPNGRSIQRPLRAGRLAGAVQDGAGGIVPDHVVYAAPPTRLRMVLEATGSFTSFATVWLHRQGPISEEFTVTNAVLDEFQAYLAQRNIQPGVGEWSTEREWIRSRLKQEIFNQAFGVAKGDQIELERDPVVGKAIEVLVGGQ